MSSLTRRRFLGSAAAATVAALAGCGGNGSQTAPYRRWTPAADGVRIAHIDLSLSGETSQIDPYLPLVLPADGGAEPSELVPQINALEDVSDPLIRLPFEAGGAMIGIASLSFAAVGLSHLIQPEASADEARQVTEFMVINDASVGIGEIDVEQAAGALENGTEGPFGDRRFERRGEQGSYTLYQAVGEGSGTVALSTDTVVVSESRESTEAVLAAARDETERAATTEPFGWLLDSVGAGDLAVGWVGPIDYGRVTFGPADADPPTEVITRHDSVLGSISFLPGSEALEAEFALERGDESETPVSAFKERLGMATSEPSVTVDGNRITASATYDNDEVDLAFTNPTTTPETTVPASGENLPPAVAEAVSPSDFTFEYRPENDAVRVNFVGDITADRVTIRTVESEYEASTTSVEAITYLTVYVDPAGDEVRVIVTVDGQRGVVATKTIP